MTTFAWSGRTRGGDAVDGVERADSRAALAKRLRARAVQPLSIEERKAKGLTLPTLGGSVGDRELAIFTRQLSVMVDSGLPLVQSLEVLGDEEENRTLAKAVQAARADIESGMSMSDAMRRQPKVFDELYCSMVAAGEAGGILDVILRRLSTYIEKAARLRSRVRAAMIYPAAVVSISIVVVWVILWRVIPTFAELFAGLGAPLPLFTQAVVAMSAAVGRYGLLMFAGLALTGFLVRSYHQTDRGRRVIDRALLRAPVVGEVLRKVAVARFSRTLATLTAAGVPIMDSMEITARTAGNAIVEDAVMAARSAVLQGQTIAEPLRATGVFPGMVIRMVSVGEQTGALDTMLSKIADFYDDEVDTAVEGLLSLMEPMLIAFLGVVIGGIVVAMYLPIFTIIQHF